MVVWLLKILAIQCNSNRLDHTSIERLDELCAVRNMRLTADEMKFLEEPYAPKLVAGHI